MMINTYSNMHKDAISKMTIKKKIRTLRKELKLTQGAFAEKAGFPRITIQTWESKINDTIPDTQSLIQLCNTYGVDLDYFTDRISAHDRDIDFIMKYTGLSEKSVLKLQEMKRFHPSALNVLDALLQSDSEENNNLRLSSDSGMYFLQSIALYFFDRQAIDILNGYSKGKYSAYSIKDSSIIPNSKKLERAVVRRLIDLHDRKDLEEFKLSKDIFALLDKMYGYFKAKDSIAGVPIDNDKHIEIGKNTFS